MSTTQPSTTHKIGYQTGLERTTYILLGNRFHYTKVTLWTSLRRVFQSPPAAGVCMIAAGVPSIASSSLLDSCSTAVRSLSARHLHERCRTGHTLDPTPLGDHSSNRISQVHMPVVGLLSLLSSRHVQQHLAKLNSSEKSRAWDVGWNVGYMHAKIPRKNTCTLLVDSGSPPSFPFSFAT